MNGSKRVSSAWLRWVTTLPVQLVLGTLLVVAGPALTIWGWAFWLDTASADVHGNSMLFSGLAFAMSVLTLHRLQAYPGTRLVSYILPMLTGWFVVAATVLLMTRLAYSRSALLSGYTLGLIWCFAQYFLFIRHRKLHLAVVPFGKAREMTQVMQLTTSVLDQPALPTHPRVDAVVADLTSEELSDPWVRFLARCTLEGTPVYHIKQIQESVTGQVRIKHLVENEFGSLLPSPLYTSLKRLIDLTVVLISLPLTLTLILLLAIVIRLDSPGPALFTQARIGKGNREFRIIKLRSMTANAEHAGAQLAQADDARITRIGRIIRKTRLDELPQFLNVLRGDMSLIGPRPEQRPLVLNFEAQIPFYSYRHVVRPGITGWAQVMQGYAGDTEDTRIKLQYDLYYIKHLSLWLDILIALKTLRILVSGKGAR